MNVFSLLKPHQVSTILAILITCVCVCVCVCVISVCVCVISVISAVKLCWERTRLTNLNLVANLLLVVFKSLQSQSPVMPRELKSYDMMSLA